MEKQPSLHSKDPGQMHKDQVTRQIVIPLVTVCVVSVAVFVFLILSTNTSTQTQSLEQWAQISTMFLLLPMFLLALVLLAIIILLSVLFGKLNRRLPLPVSRIRNKTTQILASVQHMVQKPVDLLIGIKAFFAGIKRVISNR